MRFLNKTVVVTGATSGLGLSLVKALQKEGANLVLVARREELLAEIAKGTGAIYLPYDLEDAPERLAEWVIDQCGKVDVLINNAGFGEFSMLDDVTVETIESMNRINVLSPVRLTKALLPAMPTGGMVINIASQAGKLPTPKSTIYCMTKAAMIQFSNALRLELKPRGIHVMTVNPGPIATAFFKRADLSGKYEGSVASIVLSPDHLAVQVVQSAMRRKRELNAPWWMEASAKLYAVAPRIVEWIGKSGFDKK
ncbi:SDR family NAD(P)-dependent oxidoreductase [Exiguobacterium flavidum]|uniref:SDR family NAD(P)-dependent oxidoreductase n=1 Tax=Exiguobacterium flavidum TaxID=2184695 RepID=UPI000DF73469|nr:SDR family oxidoreductase [Exiguobacterium flavidum]